MAKRHPPSRPPRASRTPAKPRAAAKPGRRPRVPDETSLPSLAELKRARAKLEAAIAALERKRTK